MAGGSDGCTNWILRSYLLADELRRGTHRICQQIAEGTGRWPRAEQRGAYAAARGVVLEVVPLLELARRASLLPIEMHESIKGELEVLSRMLGGLIRGSEQKAGSRGRRIFTGSETPRPCRLAGPCVLG